MKTVALFGAGGGLGSQLLPLLKQKYNVIGIRSADVDVTNNTWPKEEAVSKFDQLEKK
jgi:dTDP-4-dehydrorhamnose reductase